MQKCACDTKLLTCEWLEWNACTVTFQAVDYSICPYLRSPESLAAHAELVTWCLASTRLIAMPSACKNTKIKAVKS